MESKPCPDSRGPFRDRPRTLAQFANRQASLTFQACVSAKTERCTLYNTQQNHIISQPFFHSLAAARGQYRTARTT